jgi:hypothetical protein
MKALNGLKENITSKRILIGNRSVDMRAQDNISIYDVQKIFDKINRNNDKNGLSYQEDYKYKDEMCEQGKRRQ